MIDELTTKNLDTIQKIKEKINPFYERHPGEYRFSQPGSTSITGNNWTIGNFTHIELENKESYRGKVYSKCYVYGLTFGLPVENVAPEEFPRYNCTLYCETNNENFGCATNGTHVRFGEIDDVSL